MNTKLRTGPKNYSEKDSFMVINNAVLGKNYAKCKKAQRWQACNNKSNKKPVSITA